MNDIALSVMALPISFLICTCLLLWAIIGSRGWWWVKAPIMLGTVYFGLAVWFSVGSYLGWATPSDPPRKFLVHWVVVDEPSKTGDDEGAIFFLVTKLPHDDDAKRVTWQDRTLGVLGYTGDDTNPKLYQRPYSRPLHRAACKVKQMCMRGLPVIGEFKQGKFGGPAGEKGDGEAGEGEPGEGKGKKGDGKEGKGRGHGGDNQNMGDFVFYVLPPPNYPPKHGGNPQRAMPAAVPR